MISPELLRRYPFFSALSEDQLRSLSMIGRQATYQPGEILQDQGTPAQVLYFLLDGGVELSYVVEDSYYPEKRREIDVSDVAPGEPFCISALIEPRVMTAAVRASRPSQVVAFDRQELYRLFGEDPSLEIILMRRIAKAAMERLHAARTMLAAAWA